MSFARTAAVAGVGTVSCTGTTTVTGTGTAFAFGLAAIPTGTQARVGGTITVGGVTKTITAITSATSLTVDSAFGTFTAQSFTVQTGITQTGTDTMNLSLGSAAGFTITNRADLYRTFDAQGNDLTITGTLTVSSSVAQLRNDGSCNNRLTVVGSASGGELIFNGRISTAGNGPIPYAGLDWLGTNGMGGATALNSTNATYPAKLTLIDACIRFGGDWFTVSSGNFARITTQGDECWILCAKGTGTVQARIRLNNNTPVIDLQAKQTWIGTWLNFGVPQVSLKGFTPIFTDGPEINLDTIPVASRITLEDYDTRYIQAAYYPGSQLVMYGGGWTRLKNNLLGSNITWRSVNAAVGRYNIVELSKQVKAISKNAAGTLLSDGYLYFTPVGSNVAGIRPKGVTTDVTFDLSKKTIQTVSGVAETEFVYAWDYSVQNVNESTYNYFCSGTTKGDETHPAYVSRYGYDTQPITMQLSGNNTFEYTAFHTSLPTTDKIIANAQALSGVTFNFTTKTMTITGSNTIQTVYDQYQYQRNLPANLGVVDECTVSNGRTNYVGWTIVVNAGVTLSEGGNFTEIQAGTVTNNGTITAIYVSSAGTSTIWRFEDIQVGSSIVVYDSTGVTKYFQGSVTSAGDYNYYIPPGTTGTYSWAIEQYGKQRQSGSFAANTGGLLFYAPIYVEDVGISQATQATVAAYTTLETNSKLYDYVAYFRLSEQGIKLGQIATRSGTSIEFGSYSGIVKATHTSVLSITGSTITIKANGLAGDVKFSTIIATPPATWTAFSTEVITTEIEDGNGDSSLTISAAAVSTFEIWKITDATNPDNYATGTLVATVGIGKYRFLHADGYKFVVRDTTTNYRVVVEAEKGTYKAELFFGAAVQLAQAAEVSQINTKVDIMAIDLDAIKGTGFTKNKHSLTNIKKKAALAAALSA